LYVQQRLPALDGLRGAAILLVLIWHTVGLYRPATGVWGEHFPGNICWSGVDLFFVLSGFLIGGILIDNKNASNAWSVFYGRRALRILEPVPEI
jgi:peptidoglycan/LPS O-acetylase OafA/YrhL